MGGYEGKAIIILGVFLEAIQRGNINDAACARNKRIDRGKGFFGIVQGFQRTKQRAQQGGKFGHFVPDEGIHEYTVIQTQPWAKRKGLFPVRMLQILNTGLGAEILEQIFTQVFQCVQIYRRRSFTRTFGKRLQGSLNIALRFFLVLAICVVGIGDDFNQIGFREQADLHRIPVRY